MQIHFPDAAAVGDLLLQARDERRVGGRIEDRPPRLVERRPALQRDEKGPRPAGAVQPVAPEKWGEQFMELVNMDIYSREFGVWWEEPTFMNSANTII